MRFVVDVHPLNHHFVLASRQRSLPWFGCSVHVHEGVDILDKCTLHGVTHVVRVNAVCSRNDFMSVLVVDRLIARQSHEIVLLAERIQIAEELHFLREVGCPVVVEYVDLIRRLIRIMIARLRAQELLSCVDKHCTVR